jgi:hypothetical protein
MIGIAFEVFGFLAASSLAFQLSIPVKSKRTNTRKL